MHSATDKLTCTKVMQVSGLAGWMVGRSKVFLKYWHVEKLDMQLTKFQEAAILLQKWGRGFLARQLRRRLQAAAVEAAKDAMAFLKDIAANSSLTHKSLARSAQADEERKAKGEKLLATKRKPPPPPKQLSEAELKREATISWWKAKEKPRGAGQDEAGDFLPWFHGPISRKEAERMLRPRKVGCFLVRVSENRIGYTLSYRTKDRCKHFMVEQDTRGRYALVGMDKIANSLNALINWYQRNRMNAEGEMLREACGQDYNEDGEEQCNYGELVEAGTTGFGFGFGEDDNEDGGGGSGGGGSPRVSRSSKPSSEKPAGGRIAGRASGGDGGGAPPRISRASKPTNI